MHRQVRRAVRLKLGGGSRGLPAGGGIYRPTAEGHPQAEPCLPISLTAVTPRALREDRTLIAAADYVASAIGQRFTESVPLNLERAWTESRPRTPLICLLSPGGQRKGRVCTRPQSCNECCGIDACLSLMAAAMHPWTAAGQCR